MRPPNEDISGLRHDENHRHGRVIGTSSWGPPERGPGGGSPFLRAVLLVIAVLGALALVSTVVGVVRSLDVPFVGGDRAGEAAIVVRAVLSAGPYTSMPLNAAGGCVSRWPAAVQQQVAAAELREANRIPSAKEWDAGDRTVVCSAAIDNYDRPLTASLL